MDLDLGLGAGVCEEVENLSSVDGSRSWSYVDMCVRLRCQKAFSERGSCSSASGSRSTSRPSAMRGWAEVVV
jgi:hypothetical protein